MRPVRVLRIWTFSSSEYLKIAMITFSSCSVCSPLRYFNRISFKYSNSVSRRKRSLWSLEIEILPGPPPLPPPLPGEVEVLSVAVVKWGWCLGVFWRTSISRRSRCRSREFSSITRFTSSRCFCSYASWEGECRSDELTVDVMNREIKLRPLSLYFSNTKGWILEWVCSVGYLAVIRCNKCLPRDHYVTLICQPSGDHWNFLVTW